MGSVNLTRSGPLKAATAEFPLLQGIVYVKIDPLGILVIKIMRRSGQKCEMISLNRKIYSSHL
jgi:hypothetical protein